MYTLAWMTLRYGGRTLYPLEFVVVPNFEPRILSTLTTTVAGLPESGLTTSGPTPAQVQMCVHVKYINKQQGMCGMQM